ncbi:MFS transporter [Microbulbifer sp. GL-2]|uniref:MFS transporter n=1 Tax=Microbulbifer sp. GL-2 TaxID=2591606 RepID=UPI00117E5624|nr:MFS transporter [Microbulbifer sp. GL-2]
MQFTLTRSQLLGVIALCAAIYFLTNDLAIISVAASAIELDFNGDITTTQWLINSYTLVFGVLIISGGRLADMFGRRRIYFIGSVIFVLFSILCGLATDIRMLLIFRALMGIGGALMWPSILGMIYNLIPRDQSGLAGGLIMATTGISLTLGPLLGGAITDLLNWRYTFFLNLIEGTIACLLIWKFVADDRSPINNEKIDYAGVITLSISLFSLLLALDMSVDIGFKHPLIVTLTTSFFIFLGFFIIIEYRANKNALITREIASNYKLFSAGLSALVISVVFFSPLLYIPQVLSKLHGYHATLAGIGLLPMLILFSITSYISGKLYGKIRPKLILAIGSVLICAGMFMLTNFNRETAILAMAPGLILLGVGIGLFYPTIATVSITLVPPAQASLSAGILLMFQIVGGALGLGINTTIVATSPDFLSGIARAFTVNAYLSILACVICILFVSGQDVNPNQQNR